MQVENKTEMLYTMLCYVHFSDTVANKIHFLSQGVYS